MSKMHGLVKDGASVGILEMPVPELGPQDALIKVIVGGLCRTDLYAAQGKIPTADPLVLGHEFSGFVAKVGSDVESLAEGDRVAINPVLPCGECGFCACASHDSCQSSKFLGVDRHGSFAGFIALPSRSLSVIPDNVSFVEAAYAEPIAASLAVLKAGIKPEEKGLIYGKNRFSQLMMKILSAKGFSRVDVFDHTGNDMFDHHAYDYVIETLATSESMSAIVAAVRPGGKIILKSRQHDPICIKLAELIKKEPTLHAVNYGSFEEALELISTRQVTVDDLVDGIYPLSDFKRVFRTASQSESLKPFFDLAAV